MLLDSTPLAESARVDILARLPRATNNNGPYLQHAGEIAQVYEIDNGNAKFKIELFNARSGVSTRVYLDARGGLIGDAARSFPDNDRPIPKYPAHTQGDVDRMLRALNGQQPLSCSQYDRLMGIPPAPPEQLLKDFQQWWRLR